MSNYRNGRRVQRKKKDRGYRHRVLLVVIALCTGVLVFYSLASMAWHPAETAEAAPVMAAPVPAQVTTPVPSVSPTPTPTPSPTPTPLPAEGGDFSVPAPEGDEVEDDYFSDAVFLGDSRSDGLRLYGGIRGADFLAYKSLMVFHVTGTGGTEQREIPMNDTGERKTVLSWLKEKQYAKVYMMFGVNELGYQNPTQFADAFSLCVDKVRALQPDAVLYIQSIIPIEPEKAHKFNPGAWLNNDNVAAYNEALQEVCKEKKVAFVNVQETMVDEDGVLPSEGTSDGVHFTREWYEKWYAYLKTHTVDAQVYFENQSGQE